MTTVLIADDQALVRGGFRLILELAGLVQAQPVRTLAFTNDVINSANPDFREIRDLVDAALRPPAPPTTTTAPPTTTTPPTTEPGETTSPPVTTDPGQAVEADAVC